MSARARGARKHQRGLACSRPNSSAVTAGLCLQRNAPKEIPMNNPHQATPTNTTDAEARILADSVGFFDDAMRALEEASTLLDVVLQLCDDAEEADGMPKHVNDLVTLAQARVSAAQALLQCKAVPQ
jgi:hypothetical protein